MNSAYRLFCCLTLYGLCVVCSPAQAPASNPARTPPALPLQNPTAPSGPVPIGEEPHHRLVLQNDFTHVYNVMVPPMDATLLHQHDLPYLYVVLGPADIVNAIVGKPELHQVLQDGEVHYSPGHFAHIARTDSGVAFHNITIELVHPQGTPKNLCKEVVSGTALSCVEQKAPAESTPAPDPKAGRGRRQTKKPAPEPAVPSNDVPYFESDEVRVDLYKASSGNDYVDAAPANSTLLVALTDANLDVNLAGEHVQFLHSGDVLWMPAGQRRRIIDFLGTRSSFLLIQFKDSAATPASQ